MVAEYWHYTRNPGLLQGACFLFDWLRSGFSYHFAQFPVLLQIFSIYFSQLL
jgi:hypothetical protein